MPTDPTMPTVLQEIVAGRRTQLPAIAQRIEHVHDLPRSTRSLYDALEGHGNFIMECKSSSPSLGTIRTHYEPGAIARVYSRYAAAISVLCEPDHFGGDYDHLATVALSTHLPVLCKDFIVDEIQVRAARYFGADAILLMLSVLDDEQYRHLARAASELGMDVLTEVVDAEQMQRATRLGASIIGINHRDLHDLSIDLGRSERLQPLVPADARLVCESGIRDHATVRRLASYANGYLVGSQLTSQDDIDLAARTLVYGSNKVCGLTTASAAQVARAAGATHGGLIFEASSPRFVDGAQARSVMDAEPGLRFVGVTRRTDRFTELPLDGLTALQLHAPTGSPDEERALIARARTEAPGLEIWRAVSMTESAGRHGPRATIESLAPLVDRLVLDSGDGGSGRPFDWSLIPDDESLRPRLVLAGGLTLDNLPVALETGLSLDLNSGFETHGRKDAGLIRDAFRAIRQAGAPGRPTPDSSAVSSSPQP